MLIAITPRVRYRPTARCARCTVSSLFSAVPRVTDRGEFRQLSANLLNSNLTGSHLPPLVPPYTLYPRPSSKSTGLTLPRIELYRRPETLSPPSPRFLTLPCPVFSTPFQVTRRKRRFVDSSRWDRGLESERRNLWKREEKRLERVIGKLKSLLDNISFKIQILFSIYILGFLVNWNNNKKSARWLLCFIFRFFLSPVFKKRLSFFTRYVNAHWAHFALCKIILLQYTVL